MDILQLKKNDDCENTYSVNLLHLLVNHASRYIEEENGNKYLILDFTNENKDLLKKYSDVWNGIKNEIKTINDGKKKMIVKKIT